MLVLKPVIFTLTVIAMTAGCKTRDRDASKVKDIFSTSRRRPVQASEAPYVARIEACTGFFLRTTNGRTLMMTARHCFEHSLAAAREFCSTSPYNTVTDHTGKVFTCKDLVAGDETFHDILVFEFKEPRNAPSLRLALFEPQVGMRLKMLGYPGDKFNTDRSVAWASENCEVKAVDLESPHASKGKGSKDISFRHDCSTYGGNSGGPMLIEGTDIAIGMPNRFDPTFEKADHTLNWKGDDYSFGAALWDFATAHRSRLVLAGVDFATKAPESISGPDYFYAGKFAGTGKNCVFVTPFYTLGRSVTAIRGTPCEGGKSFYFDCLPPESGKSVCAAPLGVAGKLTIMDQSTITVSDMSTWGLEDGELRRTATK